MQKAAKEKAAKEKAEKEKNEREAKGTLGNLEGQLEFAKDENLKAALKKLISAQKVKLAVAKWKGKFAAAE